MNPRSALTRLRGLLPRKDHRLLFAFSGAQGAWPGMGRELYRTEAVFRDSIDASDEMVREVLGWSAAAHFRGEDDRDSTPAARRRSELIRLGLLQIAQVDLWRSVGIEPAGVLAVSLGENTAPYAGRALSLQDTARVVAVVSHASSRSPTRERLFVVDSDAAGAIELARRAPVPVHFIFTRTPTSSLLLARESDAATVRGFLGRKLVRETPSDWAFHTPRLSVDRKWAEEQLRSIKPLPPSCPIYSAAVAGAMLAPYDVPFLLWKGSRPAHLAEAVVRAAADGFDVVVNVGAAPTNPEGMSAILRSFGRKPRLIQAIREGAERESWRRAARTVQRTRFRPASPRLPATARNIDFREAAAGDRLFEIYEELRSAGPVQYLPRQRCWIVLGFEEAQQVLRDPERFSSRTVTTSDIDPFLVGNDPPDHTRVRAIVQRFLSESVLEKSTEFARRTADELLRPLVRGEEFDVVSEFAEPFATAIANEVAGVPADLACALDEQVRAAGGDTRVTHRTVRPLFEKVASSTPLYQALLPELGKAGAVSVVHIVWTGARTVRRLIPMAILFLLRDRELREQITADPKLVSPFLEEAIRLHPPEPMLTRKTTANVLLGGVAIPRGADLQVSSAAANRDPRRFEEPSSIRLDRRNAGHLSFGAATHHCVGAPIGRMAASTAFRALLRNAPDFHGIQPLSTVRWQAGAAQCAIAQLLIGVGSET